MKYYILYKVTTHALNHYIFYQIMNHFLRQRISMANKEF